MKRLLLLFPLFFLCFCSNVDHISTAENVSNRPIVPIVTSNIFNLTDVASITIDVSLAQWNKLLENYDLNSANDKKVISKFTFTNQNGTVVLDSVGLRLKGNTSRRRPEGDTGQLHNASNPDWHHSHFGFDFSKYRDAQV